MHEEERNRFIVEHYELLHKICRICATRVHGVYLSLPIEDLMGYAMEGVIHGVSRVDLSNVGWRAYIYRYCQAYVLGGAMEMMGYRRIRGERLSVSMMPVDSCEIFDVQDSRQEGSLWFEESRRMFYRFDLNWVYEHLPDCLEKRMLLMLVEEKPIGEVCEKLEISYYKYHHCVKRLEDIYVCLSRNVPIDHLLTRKSRVDEPTWSARRSGGERRLARFKGFGEKK